MVASRVCAIQMQPAAAASFDNQSVAVLLSPDDYKAYDRQRMAEIRRRLFLEMNDRLMEAVRDMANRLQQSSKGVNRTLLAQQLRASIPGARMCGQCRYGPIEHFACSALTTHRHDAYNGNACPRCGWFAADISQCPAWDGNVLEDAVDSLDFASGGRGPPAWGGGGPPFSALPAGRRGRCAMDRDASTAQRMHREEQRRLQQINNDHQVARRLQATFD